MQFQTVAIQEQLETQPIDGVYQQHAATAPRSLSD
jgi:hypothetical protein